MNIFNKVALQSMKKSRTRTVVTIIGVILSAALITGVTTFGISLLNYMVEGATARYGDWHAGFLDVDAAFVQERASDEGVTKIAAVDIIGYGILEGGQNPDRPYLFIAGYTDESFHTAPIELMYGRLPENSGEIVVSGRVETDGGVKYKVGDTLTLSVGNRTAGNRNLGQHDAYIAGGETLVSTVRKTYTVVGVCRRPLFEEDSAPYYTAVTKADPGGQADRFNLFITLENPQQAAVYASGTAIAGTYFLNDYVLRFMGASPDDKLFLGFMYTVGGIVVALIMVGSVFLIYNAFNISLNERTRQFGILSSVGATAKQLRNSVLFEGLCIGMAGIPIGVLASIGAIALLIPFIAGNFASFAYGSVALTLHLSAPAIAAAVAVSLMTILISAYIPARKAANTPVMECIRQTNEVKIKGGTVKNSKFAGRLYGLPGTLALKNFKRNKRRCRSIVLSLTLSVVLFIAVNSFGTAMNRASEMAAVFTAYDIAFMAEDIDDSEISRLVWQLKTVGGVTASMRQAVIKSYSCVAPARELSDYYRQFADINSPDEKVTDQKATDLVKLPVEIQFIEDSAYLDIINELGLSPEEYTDNAGKMIAVAVIPPIDADGRSVEFEDYIDLFASSTQDVRLVPGKNNTQGLPVNMVFVRIVPPDMLPILSDNTESPPLFFRVLAPYSVKGRFVTENTPLDVNGITFRSENPSQSAAEMETMLQGMADGAAYRLINLRKTMEDTRSMGFVASVFAYLFIIMISLIAVANVFNTISTNIKLRRRELAMLRSVGMSDRDFNRMMNFECGFYGMRTLLFGLPIAGIISWLIYKGLVLGGADGIGFLFPWAGMMISVIGVFLIVFVTTQYAISKIKKEHIIDALRDDMT